MVNQWFFSVGESGTIINTLYSKAREKFLEGSIDWVNDDIKAILVHTTGYIVDILSDEFLSDIPEISIVATSDNLSGKTISDGVANASDVQFPLVNGDTVEAVVLFKDTGNSATSPLLVYINTVLNGVPITLDGGNITIQWDNGTNKIFKL